MNDRFDVVVIGSGFGGSVMAYRLAAAGKRVCLLERGKPYPPGSFSRTPLELHENFWDPSAQHYGLFNIWSFRHIASIVSAGLGGGSLIYANVMIRKDENWFVSRASKRDGYESWPVTRKDLDPHYDAVQRIQHPAVYPEEYQRDNKTAALRAAAKRLGIQETTFDKIDPTVAQWYLPLLAITFAQDGEEPIPGRVFDPGNNYHKAPRETCRLCGECDVGCTYGAKNTLDYTYVTHAQNAGADIRPLTEVKSFRPADEGKGWRVTCVTHHLDQRTTPGVLPPDHYELHADKLVVSAGTLGSTYLMLKMQAEGNLRNVSSTLGQRFSGNGDLLMLATRATDPKGEPVRLNASRAPVITSTFRFPDSRDAKGAGRGFYLQDAGYPLVADYLWELLDARSLAGRVAGFVWDRARALLFGSGGSEIDAQIEKLIGDGRMSSTSMPLLGMGRDVPDGRMTLRKPGGGGPPSLDVSWQDTRSRGYLGRVNVRTKEITTAMGAQYTENPLTSTFNRLVTVHPLGGCPMGTSDRDSVVDSYGRVFGHPGLYVADGSVMPGPVGANPSFTIAALADRFAQAIIDGREP